MHVGFVIGGAWPKRSDRSYDFDLARCLYEGRHVFVEFCDEVLEHTPAKVVLAVGIPDDAWVTCAVDHEW